MVLFRPQAHDPLGRRNNIHWLWLSALVIGIDHLTKFLVESKLPLYGVVPLVPHLNLRNMHNTGAAFSTFNTAPAATFIVLGAVVSAFILAWYRRHPYDQRLLGCAFALILGGALGNAIDRALRGFVVDFVDFSADWLDFELLGFQPFLGGHFPAFNIADSAITVGAGLLILEMLLSQRKPPDPTVVKEAEITPPELAAPSSPAVPGAAEAELPRDREV